MGRSIVSADVIVERVPLTEHVGELALVPPISVIEGAEPLPLPLPRSKRILDVVVGSVALVVLLPVGLIVALLVALTSRGPVLYRQRRFGRGGRSFHILKFRTMVDGADERIAALLDHPEHRDHFREHGKLRDDPRMTRIGRVLRILSLDELPQLLSVLRGDMSLVGPRPRWSAAELSAYGSDLEAYFAVAPGLTGPWQVSGRNDLPDRERVALDLDYARNSSLARDVVLLLRTIPVLLWPVGRGAG